MNGIFQDWKANERNPKARLVLVMFRLAYRIRSAPKIFLILGLPYLLFYRVFVEWVLGIELPWKLKIGKDLRIYHGQSLVVHDHAIIGRNCVLRHCTTIGIAKLEEFLDGKPMAPVLGDNVDVGSNVCIIGSLRIGDGAIIGAGSVVVKDVPAGAVVAGNPARILRMVEPSAQH